MFGKIKTASTFLCGLIVGVSLLISCGGGGESGNSVIPINQAEAVTNIEISSYDLIGTWKMNYVLTLDVNKPGQETNSTATFEIEKIHDSTGEFTGVRVNGSGEADGAIYGRVISASGNYTEDLVEFNLIEYDKSYRSIFIGHVEADNKITHGSFVDTYGNVAEFEMTKVE